ncbi:MAG: DUF4105 domain-containing protein [Bacteroides sp.]|nr:DUF4105 domain-containing protein [Bacteroides sp.]
MHTHLETLLPRHRLKRLLLTLTMLAALLTGRAMSQDSICLSLLTCGPGEEIYSLFGHTALRYECPAKGIDWVYNYGVFSFDTPNFVLRFCLGETDYRLGRMHFQHFLEEYRYRGREVWQQELNLKPEEKRRLVEQLETNYRPENRVYRYNFFYDNCATRPRDQVERCVEGSVAYAEEMESTDTGVTFRDLLREHTEGHPWARFGINLCLGSKADVPISRREMMFAPYYVKDFFQRASIKQGSDEELTRPLVCPAQQLLPTVKRGEESGYGTTPMMLVCLLLAVVATVTFCEMKYKKRWWGVDFVLLTAAGITGFILAFLTFLSQHPAVCPNYQLFLFHPLHLLALPAIVWSGIKGRKCRYMQANFIVLTLFILLWPLIPQKIDLTVLPLALCLWIRSMSYIKK